MEVKHFSHPHPLTLNSEQLYVDGKQAICFGCEDSILGPSYYDCKSCDDDFFLHEKCFQLPKKIKRVLHPQHPLFLSAGPPSSYEGSIFCNSCKKACKKSFYRCSLCHFNLDIQCAFPPCINYGGSGQHEHQFRCLLNSLSLESISFTCNACGTHGDNYRPFMCIMCQLTVHEECISLPRTIETSMHRHRQLIHTNCLQQCESVKHRCGICRLKVLTDYGGYHCPDCDFVAHVKCCKRAVKSATEIAEEIRKEEEEEEEQRIARNDEFMESAFSIVREVNNGVEKIIMEIKHFSHQHNLVLVENNFDNDHRKCDGCMLLISAPFYGCIECNFFLHKACVELPRRKQVQHHPHPLTLISVAWENDGFDCSRCGRYCYGFRYICESEDKRCGNVCFDIRCMGLFEESFQHEGHEHPLFLAHESNSYDCSSCGDEGDGEYGFLIRCTASDDFNLDIECATLPYKARHKDDEHPLFLTYVDPNPDQFDCQICERVRDPLFWFYRCEKCNFDAHTECALGKYPFVKLGNPRLYGFHPHPLVLVEKTKDEDHPACHTCFKPCEDLALECKFKCDFIIHGKGGDCMPPF